MKSLSKKICPHCVKEFEYESWNKTKIYCSRSCKDIAGRGSRSTTEEWILQAKKKHGNRYDYTYTDISDRIDNKISIGCRIHGIFYQDPSQHLIGKGCKQCSSQKQFMSTEEFIDKCNKVHKNKYDYSLTVYENIKKHVKIICPDHGMYLQSPFQHLYHKTGCHTCAQVYTSSKGELEWLDYIGVPNDKDHRQFYLILENKKFWVDGISEKTIYEYLGDYWHGNPAVFSPSDFNKTIKKSYGELYDETFKRFSALENHGYTIKYIWESEWLKK